MPDWAQPPAPPANEGPPAGNGPAPADPGGGTAPPTSGAGGQGGDGGSPPDPAQPPVDDVPRAVDSPRPADPGGNGTSQPPASPGISPPGGGGSLPDWAQPPPSAPPSPSPPAAPPAAPGADVPRVVDSPTPADTGGPVPPSGPAPGIGAPPGGSGVGIVGAAPPAPGDGAGGSGGAAAPSRPAVEGRFRSEDDFSGRSAAAAARAERRRSAAVSAPTVEPAPAPAAAPPAVVAVDPPGVVSTRRPPVVEPPQAVTARRIRPVTRSGTGDQGPRFRQTEISVLGITSESQNVLSALGFRTISARRSPLLGNRMIARLRTPTNVRATDAVADLRRRFPELTVDLTHLYRPAQAPASVRYGHELVGLASLPGCGVATRVGLIDTGISRHPSLARTRVVERSFVDRRAGTSAVHGTAVASLLVGELPGTGPLSPGAPLFSANVFAADSGEVVSDVQAIIEALDWMFQEGVRVVNLSLMGPSNALLEVAVSAAAQRSLILVAAAGNDGPAAPPAFPAAYPQVVAVAAVDARGRPYSSNNRGGYVEIAAPGVDIWAAHAAGGEAFWTGTSFAVPFVTAAIAREVAAGRVGNVNDARRFLAASARDMGAPGRDPIYGHGLLQAGRCG